MVTETRTIPQKYSYQLDTPNVPVLPPKEFATRRSKELTGDVSRSYSRAKLFSDVHFSIVMGRTPRFDSPELDEIRRFYQDNAQSIILENDFKSAKKIAKNQGQHQQGRTRFFQRAALRLFRRDLEIADQLADKSLFYLQMVADEAQDIFEKYQEKAFRANVDSMLLK